MTIIYKAPGQASGISGKCDRYGSSLHKAVLLFIKKYFKVIIATVYWVATMFLGSISLI